MDLLQNFGMLLCVGALILVGLLVFSTLFRNRNKAANTPTNRPVYDQDDRVFNEQGSARPQYDDRDVQTAGGFGVPATGGSNSGNSGGFGARDYPQQPRQQDAPNGDFMDLDDRLRSRDRDGSDNPPVNRPRRKGDDDDIQSSGGFGR